MNEPLLRVRYEKRLKSSVHVRYFAILFATLWPFNPFPQTELLDCRTRMELHSAAQVLSSVKCLCKPKVDKQRSPELLSSSCVPVALNFIHHSEFLCPRQPSTAPRPSMDGDPITRA
jgi:hypothetical protein